MGRPTKYDPAMCDQVIELGREGFGKAEIAYELGVCRDTLDEWCRQHPSFSDAITRAREFSLGWWNKQGRAGVWGGKDFNAQAYSLQVRNRFPQDWRDKQEVEHSGELTLEQLVAGASKLERSDSQDS